MTRTITVLLAVALTAYLALCLVTYLRQRQLLYFPTAPVAAGDLAPLWVESGGERLKLWPLNPGRREAVVYFGGNAEQVLYARELFESGFDRYTVYLVNYRGYGGSSGRPSEAGFLTDGLNVFDAAAALHDRVSLVGRSIGSAVAVHVAATRPVPKLVLVTPMDSVEALARRHYPLLPVSLLLKDRYRADASAPAVRAKTLVVLAGDDEIVPHESSRRLVEALHAAPVTVAVIEGESHNSLGRVPDYADTMRSFLMTEP